MAIYVYNVNVSQFPLPCAPTLSGNPMILEWTVISFGEVLNMIGVIDNEAHITHRGR